MTTSIFPAEPSADPFDASASSIGSEYTDARTYLAQPPRTPNVEPDAPFHGSNDSNFGLTRIGPDE